MVKDCVNRKATKKIEHFCIKFLIGTNTLILKGKLELDMIQRCLKRWMYTLSLRWLENNALRRSRIDIEVT